MIDAITSRNNKRVMYACSLKQNKVRNEERLFLMEGRKSLDMALEKNLVTEIFSIKEINTPKDIPLHIVDEKVMDKLSEQKSPEGIVFIAKYPSLNKNVNKCIYLDGVNDPGNMGTIIRTALALGYDAVYYSKDSVSPYNEKSLAASKGSIFFIPVIEKELSSLKDTYEIICTALAKDSVDISDLKVNKKHCLVFGNEANGIKKENLALADQITSIKMNDIDSLNVAIAASIYMFKFH